MNNHFKIFLQFVMFSFGLALATASSANQGNDAELNKALDQQHLTALTIYESGDYTRAFALVHALAEKGHAPSQTILASMYKDGRGTAASMVEAKVWYEKAALQGEVLAQFSMGVIYEQGHAGPADQFQAKRWYAEAAKQGFNYAQFNLAMMLFEGRGGERNFELAAEQFGNACRNGILMGCEAEQLLKNGAEGLIN